MSQRPMSDTRETPAKVVDAKGEYCPKPIIEIARAIKEVELGDLVLLLATDPGVHSDIPAWCKAMGHELVRIGDSGSVVEALVRRAK